MISLKTGASALPVKSGRKCMILLLKINIQQAFASKIISLPQNLYAFVQR
jgi:hypothetical protein